MQEKVMKVELQEMKHAMLGFQNNYNPKILYVFVNKRVNTRLFEKDHDLVMNVAPGTVVDEGIVEHFGNDSQFDFYMVPHKATVATALPVHYYVAYNNTGMTKN